MPRVVVSLLVLAAALGCSAREVEEDGESRRHLAAQWCEDWCTFWYDCNPALAESVSGCRDNCESAEGWDRTDICGDIWWDYLECTTSMTCEEHLEAAGHEEILPCQHLWNDYVREGCTR